MLRQAQNRLKLLIAQENSVAVLALASGLTGHPGGGSGIREAAPGPGVRPILSAGMGAGVELGATGCQRARCRCRYRRGPHCFGRAAGNATAHPPRGKRPSEHPGGRQGRQLWVGQWVKPPRLRRPPCSTRCARNGIPRRVAPPRLGPHRPPGGLSGGDECLDRVETQIARDRWGDIAATANAEFPDGRAVSLISNLRTWSVVRQR